MPDPAMLPASVYEPGVCNIGPAEIALRRRAGHIGAITTLGLFAALVTVRAPRGARLLVALPAAGAASGYLQAQQRFCAGFGARGVYNVGPLGTVTPVDDPGSRALDLAASRRIGRTSGLIGIMAAALAVAAPTRPRTRST